MAFTVSNIQRSVTGNYVIISGLFTSARGDNTLTFTHGLNNIVEDTVDLDAVGFQKPLVSHSAGVMTATWDDTLGVTGSFTIIGN